MQAYVWQQMTYPQLTIGSWQLAKTTDSMRLKIREPQANLMLIVELPSERMFIRAEIPMRHESGQPTTDNRQLTTDNRKPITEN
jgi:hypothetical protein